MNKGYAKIASEVIKKGYVDVKREPLTVDTSADSATKKNLADPKAATKEFKPKHIGRSKSDEEQQKNEEIARLRKIVKKYEEKKDDKGDTKKEDNKKSGK